MPETQVLTAGSPDMLELAKQVLDRGGLLAFPTDTVYGLAADAWNAGAVSRIFHAKGRSERKAIPILFGKSQDLLQVAEEPLPIVWQLADRHWPGPLTMVIRRRQDLPDVVSPTETVAVRVPDHPVALELLSYVGPLAVTSANRSGEESARDARDVLTSLGGRFELLIDAGRTPGGVPSTVLDCTTGVPRLLREGPLKLNQVLRSIQADG